MSGMGKNMITSYAALGVGLAIVLTFGLTTISSVMEQFSVSELTVSQRETTTVPALEAPVPMVPSEPPEMQEDISAKAGAPAATGGTTSGEVVIEKAPAEREEMKESYSIAAEVPVSPSPFAGFFVVLPYIAAAVVGSVVFVVTRKRVGW